MPRSLLPSLAGLFRRRTPARVLILGTGKSGTTALFFRIKNSMPAGTAGVFEPQSREPVAKAVATGKPLVTKMLMPLPTGLLSELDGWFGSRILLMRDPRDVVVSSVLYTSAYEYCWRHSEDAIRDKVALLRAKESARDRISVLAILERLWDDFDPGAFAVLIGTLAEQLDSLATPPHDYFVLKYEDLVEGRLKGLESYLRFPLTADDSVDPRFRRVVRTKGSGAWRDWFTAEDVAFFAPLFRGSMTRFGYDVADWQTRSDGRILPQHCSGYFLQVLNERRRGAGLPEIAL